MDTRTVPQHSLTQRATRIAFTAIVAALLAGCAAESQPVSTMKESSLTSGAQIATGMLPNGLMSEPYAD